MTQKYKLVFTVPSTHAEAVRKAIGEAGGGKIGNYSFCSFTTKGVGRFKPEEGARPAFGTVGKMEEIEEDKIECQCDEDVIDSVLLALKKSHPYEEVAFDVWKLESKYHSS